MPEIRVVKRQENVSQAHNTHDSTPQVNDNYITKSDLDSMFSQLNKQINPESALSPEVRSVVKAVEDVQGLKNALKDPTSLGIEQATSSLVTNVLGNALNNMSGANQQVVPQKPLLSSLAEIATHNISANLPQVLESFKSVLGEERIQKGYDVALNHVEKQQSNNDFINTVMSLDENNDEHINYYAQSMGYTNFDKAKNALIEHKVVLYQEQQEYQNIQQGQNQQINDNSTLARQQQDSYIANEQLVQEQIVQEQIVQEQLEQEQPIIEEPINTTIVEEPVIKQPLKVKINKKNKLQLKVKVDNENIIDDETNKEIDDIYNELKN